MTSTLDSVLLVMVLLKGPVLLPLLIEAENTKKTYRYVYVFLSTMYCLDNEKVDKIRYGPFLKNSPINMRSGVHSSGDVQSYPGSHGFRQIA